MMETRKTTVEVVLKNPEVVHRETITGDEAAVRARVAEIRSMGLEITDAKYHHFKSPSDIGDIRYPVM